MTQPSVIEQTLDRLDARHKLLMVEIDRLLRTDSAADPRREEVGYAVVDVARQATETVFQELHNVRDVAPGLKGDRAYGIGVQEAREYLRASLFHATVKGSPRERVKLALRTLRDAIREKHHVFRVAVLSKEAAILLLGLDRLGGVYAEWQASALGVGLLTWQEQESLNRHVLGKVRALDRAQARLDAEKYELPPFNYIEGGCFRNIAKACFRAVADGELDDFSPEQVTDIGSHALQSMQREVAINPEQDEEYMVPTMYAIEAALRENLGDIRFAKTFWERLESGKASKVVADVLRIEPSRRLREMVVTSARNAGVEVRPFRV